MATPEAKTPRRRLSPEARRAQLLACALAVFARRGLGVGHHAQIAEEAGCSISTVFVYFPTRDDLVSAVLDEVGRFLNDMAEGIHERDEPAPSVVLEHVQAFAESVEAHPDHARVWLDWSTAIRDEFWPRYLELQERVVEIISRTILRGQREGSVSAAVDPDDAARLIVGSAHMLALMKFSGRAPDKIDHFIQTLTGAALGLS